MTKLKVKNKEEYQAYLNSPRWQAIRKRLYREYEYKCAMCGSSINLNVHHITYENLGEEKDEDLTVLCQQCHSDIHGKHTFFDDLCLAWNRLFDEWEAETDKDEKEIKNIQLKIIDRAMELVPQASEIYKQIKEKEGES